MSTSMIVDDHSCEIFVLSFPSGYCYGGDQYDAKTFRIGFAFDKTMRVISSGNLSFSNAPNGIYQAGSEIVYSASSNPSREHGINPLGLGNASVSFLIKKKDLRSLKFWFTSGYAYGGDQYDGKDISLGFNFDFTAESASVVSANPNNGDPRCPAGMSFSGSSGLYWASSSPTDDHGINPLTFSGGSVTFKNIVCKGLDF